MIESFFATLKTHCVTQHFVTRQQARQVIFEYIGVWYNRCRRYSALGYLSPDQHEQLLAQTNLFSTETGQVHPEPVSTVSVWDLDTEITSYSLAGFVKATEVTGDTLVIASVKDDVVKIAEFPTNLVIAEITWHSPAER